MARLGGRVALVTGSARGIGRACAIRLAEEGANVALLDIARPIASVPYQPATEGDLDQTARRIRSIGRQAHIELVDVRDSEALDLAVARSTDALGPINVAVAAAGVDSWGTAWDLTDAQWQVMIDVNLTGVWRTLKSVAPQMIERRFGSIVLIGSVLSQKPNPNFAHYTAAKHGVRGLTRAFALELAPFSVRVNSVDPTAVATPMIESQAYRDQQVGHAQASIEEVELKYLRWNALPVPWIEARDVANAVLFLASDEARFITGHSLPVDAGALLK